MSDRKKLDADFANWLVKFAMLEGAALFAVVAYYIFVDDDLSILISGIVTIAGISSIFLFRKIAALREQRERDGRNGLDIR